MRPLSHPALVAVFAVASIVAAAALCGCVDRSLLIRSEPTGARLWVNGVERGTTPQVVRYVHEGRFDVRLEKEGYEAVADEVVTRTRWDAVPGPDFFADNLPVRIRRQTDAFFRLKPLPESYSEEELRAIVRQGEAFRKKAEEAANEPGTPRPRRPSPAAAPTTTPPTAPPPAPAPAPAPMTKGR